MPSTLEELYLLNCLSKAIKAKKYLRGHFSEDDGILLSADRTPNLEELLLLDLSILIPEKI